MPADSFDDARRIGRQPAQVGSEARRDVAPARHELDPLTGLRNDRALERDLGPLVAGTAGAFAVVTIDVEDYASYRARTGRSGAETLLRTLARAIDAATREQDPVYRYGPDVFAILLLGEGEGHAIDVARRVDATYAGFTAGADVPGLILGTARWPGDGTAMRDLLRAAETAGMRLGGDDGYAEVGDGSRGETRAQLFDAVISAATAIIAAPDDRAVADAALAAARDMVNVEDLFIALPGRHDLGGVAACGTFAEAPVLVRLAGEAPDVWARAWQTGRILAASAGDPAAAHSGGAKGAGSPSEMLLAVPFARAVQARPVALLGMIVPDAEHVTPPLLDALTRLGRITATVLETRHGRRGRAGIGTAREVGTAQVRGVAQARGAAPRAGRSVSDRA